MSHTNVVVEKIITISFFHLSPLPDIKYKGGETYTVDNEKDYKKRLKKIMNNVITSGYNLQILQCQENHTVCYIDNGRFRQS